MGKRSLLTPSLIAVVGLLTISPVLMLVFGSFTEGLGTFGAFTVSMSSPALTVTSVWSPISSTV